MLAPSFLYDVEWSGCPFGGVIVSSPALLFRLHISHIHSSEKEEHWICSCCRLNSSRRDMTRVIPKRRKNFPYFAYKQSSIKGGRKTVSSSDLVHQKDLPAGVFFVLS